MPYQHIPVMLKEAVEFLHCRPGKIYADGTLGGSGHAQAICERIVPKGLLIGIDQDAAAIKNAESVLAPYRSSVRLFHDNFVHLPEIFSEMGITAVDGILLDLGLSLHQLKSSRRGFSFKRDEPLDMRMDTRTSTRAEDLVNTLDEAALSRIFKTYGEERLARRIARRIVKVRSKNPIRSSLQLACIVSEAVPAKVAHRQKIHPATRVFMALRIAVNRELQLIERFMEGAVDLLNQNGRLCVIAFHSLEDRIVKHAMKTLAKDCLCPPAFPKCVCGKIKQVRILTPKAIRPQPEEVAENPMARSALLRVMQKIVP